MPTAVRGGTHRLLVSQLLAKYSLFRQRDRLVFPHLADTTFQNMFRDKIGNEIWVKRPYYTKISSGRTLTDSDKRKIIDLQVPIKVDKWWKHAISYDAEMATFDLKNFHARYADSGIEELGYEFDVSGAEALADGLGYFGGTPGSAFSVDTAQDIRAHATQVSIPIGMDNYAVLNPVNLAAISKDLDKNLFHKDIVNDVVRHSYRGMIADWNAFMSIHIPDITVTKIGTPLVMGAGQRGSTITTDGWGTSKTPCIRKGQVIQFTGVYETQLRGRRKTNPRLKSFTVMEDASSNSSGTGVATIKISPDLNDGELTIANGSGGTVKLDGMQNVSTVPADNAPIIVMGDNGKRYARALFFKRGALHYASMQIQVPDSFYVRTMDTDMETGLSVAVTEEAQLSDLSSTMRADASWGADCLRPEFGIVVWTDATN